MTLSWFERCNIREPSRSGKVERVIRLNHFGGLSSRPSNHEDQQLRLRVWELGEGYVVEVYVLFPNPRSSPHAPNGYRHMSPYRGSVVWMPIIVHNSVPHIHYLVHYRKIIKPQIKFEIGILLIMLGKHLLQIRGACRASCNTSLECSWMEVNMWNLSASDCLQTPRKRAPSWCVFQLYNQLVWQITSNHELTINFVK